MAEEEDGPNGTEEVGTGQVRKAWEVMARHLDFIILPYY